MLTIEECALQILREAHVRGPQGLVQLIEAVAVVLAFQVTLNVLQQLLDLLQPGIKIGHLLLGSHLLKKFDMAIFRFGGLAAEVAGNAVSGVIEALNTAAEIRVD